MTMLHSKTRASALPFLLLAAAAVSLVLSACSEGALAEALTTEEAAFSFAPAAGTVLWWSADNTPLRHTLTAAEAEAGSVTLTVRKGSVTPVLLYRTDEHEPSGCIWPVTGTMSTSGGFSSRMLWRLLAETDPATGPPEAIRAYLERFNWKRFCEEAAKLDDPWELDQQRILKAIAGGTFTLRDLSAPH